MQMSWEQDFEEFGFKFGDDAQQPSSLGGVTHNNRSAVLMEKRKKVYELDLFEVDYNEWHNRMYDLWCFDQESAVEVISDFCSSYSESPLGSLRQVCEYVVRQSYIDFVTRTKCASALGNDFYMLEVLDDFKLNPKEDLNFTLYAEYLCNIVPNLMVEDNTIESHCIFVFTTKQIPWAVKYKLFKTVADSRSTSMVLLGNIGKVLITENSLSSYTVLCLQLYKFNEALLKQLLNRSKSVKDTNIKADLYDHLLDHPELKQEALKLLKAIGEGLKTLDSTQNVHMVTADVDSWIVMLAEFIPDKDAISKLKERYEATTDPEKYESIEYALQRIEQDNSVYGRLYYKMSGILQRLFDKINKHEHAEELFDRLKEELTEMSHTCSRGHLYRLMNVFTGFEDSGITIDPSVEMRNVINKRVEKYMETLKDQYEEKIAEDKEYKEATFIVEYDEKGEACGGHYEYVTHRKKHESEVEEKRAEGEDLYSQVLDAWMNEDESILQKYLYPQLSLIHDEMMADYVGQGILSPQDFSIHYRDIVNKLFTS